jgi:ribonuclease HI
MDTLSLFTDVSCNAKYQLGFGAYLLVSDSDLNAGQKDILKNKVKFKKFEFTSSTKLEIETVSWALKEVEKIIPKFDLPGHLILYTDSQCIAGLLNRRAKLERLNFKSIGKNRELNYAALYREFYQASDKWQFKLVKLEGHSKSLTKDRYHTMFSYVDKGSRKALKSYLKKIPLLNKQET